MDGANLRKQSSVVYLCDTVAAVCRMQGAELKFVVMLVPQNFQTAIIQILICGLSRFRKFLGNLLKISGNAFVLEYEVEFSGNCLIGCQIIDKLGILQNHIPTHFIGLIFVAPPHLFAVGINISLSCLNKDLKRHRRNPQIACHVVDDVLLLQQRLEIEVGRQYFQNLQIPSVLRDNDTLTDIHNGNKGLCSVWKPAARNDGFFGTGTEYKLLDIQLLVYAFSFTHCAPLYNMILLFVR